MVNVRKAAVESEISAGKTRLFFKQTDEPVQKTGGLHRIISHA
jgi:hypothetical protein